MLCHNVSSFPHLHMWNVIHCHMRSMIAPHAICRQCYSPPFTFGRSVGKHISESKSINKTHYCVNFPVYSPHITQPYWRNVCVHIASVHSFLHIIRAHCKRDTTPIYHSAGAAREGSRVDREDVDLIVVCFSSLHQHKYAYNLHLNNNNNNNIDTLHEQEIAAWRHRTRCSFSCTANRSSGARAIRTTVPCWPATGTSSSSPSTFGSASLVSI